MNHNDLQNLAESWLRVVTIFLALQVAVISFLLSNTQDDKVSFTTISYFGLAMVAPMFMAVAMFLGARDPRMARFPRQTVLDTAVACTGASCIVSAIGAGYGAFVLTESLTLAIVISIGLIGTMCIFYPYFYYRYLHQKRI